MSRAAFRRLAAGSALALSATVAAQTFDKHEPLALAVPSSVLDAADNADQIMRGAYLARAADCTACHTVPGEAPFAGGYAFDTPVGTIYSPNITSDPEYGLGDWTAEEFEQSLRAGVAPRGHLYPAMPYAAYTGFSDEDIAALWAYFQQVEPVNAPAQENDLMWPFSWRGAMWFWNLLFFDEGRFEPLAQQSEQWNRGKFLVDVPGHCGSCHTPRNFAMAQKQDQMLTGGKVQGWYAPSLVSGPDQPLDDLSVEEVEALLATGRSADRVTAGIMNEAVHNSLQYLQAEDRRAMALYVKSLRLEDGDVVVAARDTRSGSAPRQPQRPDGAADPVAVWRIEDPAAQIGGPGGTALTPGERLYVDNCQACHLSGQGMEMAFPALSRESAVSMEDPTNLLHVILDGAQNAQTRNDPTVLTMPNFDWRLDDDEIATLASYVRETFGGLAADVAAVDAETVAELRDADRGSHPN